MSGTDKYRVMPAELVSTCWLPIVLAVKVVPPELEASADEAGLLPAAAGVLLVAAVVLAVLLAEPGAGG